MVAKLLVPVDPAVPGPVTAAVTKAVVGDGRVAIPKGTVFVGTSRRGMADRVEIGWDSFNVAGATSTSFDGQAFGKDRKVGLPALVVGGASAGGDAKGAAIHTAERLADRILGDGVVSDLGRGLVEAAGSTARRGVSAESDTKYEVIPSGTPFFIFVERSL